MFGRELLENVLDQISKEMYGGKFDLLGKEQQLVVLRAMLELRRKKADALYELYKSDDVEKNRVAQEILKVPVELSVIPTEPPAAAFS